MFVIFWLIMPLTLSACAGIASALMVHAYQNRRVVSVTAWCVFLFISIGLLFLFNQMDDPRLPNVAPWDLIVAVATNYVTRRVGFITDHRIHALTVLTPLCAIIAGLYIVCGTISPFRMSIIQSNSTTSPDGRYVATLAYTDGLTYGYYFVIVKPRHIWNIFEGGHEVTEAAAEGIDTINWKGNHTLVVHYDKECEFEVQEKRWRDVGIEYIEDGGK